MRDGALLVNVARGPVVRTDDLVAEVGTGRLRAALDVTDPEPLPPGHPLWSAPGVLVSPHVGGNTSAFLPRRGPARRGAAAALGRGRAARARDHRDVLSADLHSRGGSRAARAVPTRSSPGRRTGQVAGRR